MLKRHLMPETLEKLLKNELMPAAEPEEEKTRKDAWLDRLRQKKGVGDDE